MKSPDSTEHALPDGVSVHVVGAGGAGMNAIAAVLLSMGHQISGSDLRESVGVNRLRSLGARINIGHSAANIGDAAVICRSTAVPDSNAEILAAQDLVLQCSIDRCALQPPENTSTNQASVL